MLEFRDMTGCCMRRSGQERGARKGRQWGRRDCANRANRTLPERATVHVRSSAYHYYVRRPCAEERDQWCGALLVPCSSTRCLIVVAVQSSSHSSSGYYNGITKTSHASTRQNFLVATTSGGPAPTMAKIASPVCAGGRAGSEDIADSAATCAAGWLAAAGALPLRAPLPHYSRCIRRVSRQTQFCRCL